MTEVGALRPKRIIENGKIVNYEQVNIIDVAGGTGDIAFKILEKQKRWDPDLKTIKVLPADPAPLPPPVPRAPPAPCR